MNNQTVVCDICGHTLGKIDLDSISIPMKPYMFKSISERRGIAPPFLGWMEWIQFMCRQCGKRPFHKTDHITIMNERSFKKVIDISKLGIEKKVRLSNQNQINEIFGNETIERPTPVSRFQKGIVKLLKTKRTKKEQPKKDKFYKCVCGKRYKHQPSLIRHQRKCDG